MRIAKCFRCGKVDMLDQTDLCLSCTMCLNPTFAQVVEEYQKERRKENMTPIVFRKYENKEIISLFPTIRAGEYDQTVQSYMHFGQHGDADYNFVVSKTKLATPEEYKELLAELTEIGYVNLKVYKRFRA